MVSNTFFIAIKKYLFNRKVRWYRKDEMTITMCKHRLKIKMALRYINKQTKLIESLDRTITLQDSMIRIQKELISKYENPPKVVYKSLSPDGQWELGYEN